MKKEIFYIKVTDGGPFLVYGNPPIDQEIIVPNKDGKSWIYKKGKHFNISPDAPYCALCRCGESKHAPFCDGSHKTAIWNSKETANFIPIMDKAKVIEGPKVILADNENLNEEGEKTGKIYEPKFEPAIGIIEDSQIAISGPIWVKGGIRIESSNGRSYEIRNRVVICRCGCSSNKPFCDGTHATAEYYDGLGFEVGNP
ncbi:MAG: CDGSH iron-sulfur domain-containing protein [Bacteroidales bacterium]